MDNQLKIINYLGKNITEEFTMHNLSCILKIPYATFYRTIIKMDALLKKRIIGKSSLLSLNLKNRIISGYLAISSEIEKESYIKNQKLIKKIVEELNTENMMLLFGSYAKGKQTEKSDIDLLIIGEMVDFRKYELIFRKKINTIYVKAEEFAIMLKDENQNVGKQVLQNHIILNNPLKFWELVLGVCKNIQGNG